MTGLFLQSGITPRVQNSLDVLAKLRVLSVCASVHFFFSGEKSHNYMIYKGFDDTSKGKKLGASALKYF